MYELNYCIILIFTVLISRACGNLTFNNLHEKLVLFTRDKKVRLSKSMTAKYQYNYDGNFNYEKLITVKPNKSLVGSSLFVRFPLCKLASVATGEAKEELMTVLGYKEDAMINTCYTKLKEYMKSIKHTDMTQVNRIYVNYTDDIDPSFFTNSTEKFGVQVEKVGFNYPKAALSYINRLVSTATYKRIADILEPKDINKDTMMVIVNGVHFKGTWEFPFDHRLTKLMPFHHIDNRISKVPMMTKVDEFAFVASGDVKVLSIKFGCWRSSITFVVPNSHHDMPKLIDKMEKEPTFVSNLVKKLKGTPLRVFLPRFKIKTYVDWTGFLQELGVYAIFNKNSSGLSMLKEGSRIKNIPLNKIKQKLFIQIDELGISRFTHDPILQMGPPSMPLFLEVPKFTADRPFYFQVTADIGGFRYETLSGVYYGPELSPIPT